MAIATQLQARIEQHETAQVDLRMEMNQRTLDQNKLLFTARQVNEKIKAQLQQANQTIDKKNQRIAQIEGELNLLLKDHDQIIAQLDQSKDQLDIKDDQINDIQKRLDATAERLRKLEEQLVKERHNTTLRNRIAVLEVEEKRLTESISSLTDMGLGGGHVIGALSGLLVGGPVGAIFGFYAGVLAGGGIINEKHNQLTSELEGVKSERKTLNQQLMMG